MKLHRRFMYYDLKNTALLIFVHGSHCQLSYLLFALGGASLNRLVLALGDETCSYYWHCY
ncbi:hypothetical protein MA16_Dca000660 [Dendrobium catenatum]|uniref:Uncharacterized protein n=1 Tax=Dendrobium catenatum TaxID=906689 RepID=A0A2I0WUH4_9ASPA|nr:hypothetical protein MA16_Dca000660 [Dendrobium catenatum]